MDFAGATLRNRTTALVLLAGIVVAGWGAFQSMSRLEDPEFTIKSAQVFTPYPGATAQQVADEVTEVIETAVQQLGQLDYVKSKSYPGRSIVTVEIKNFYGRRDLPQIWDELRRKVNDAQGKLPPGAGPSLVNDDFGDVFGLFFAVYGDGFTYRELYDHAKMLQRELLLVRDVAKVTLFGTQKEAIYVEISRSRLAQLGISERSIYAALEGKNLVVPSGEADVGRTRVLILPEPGLESVESIGNVVIQGIASSRQIFLRDIADIWRGYQDPPGTIFRFNGRAAIGMGVSTASGGNVVTMGDAVKQRLEELQSETPIGIELGEVYWQSDLVTSSISNFMISLLQALAIVIGVLLFAMGARSGLLIGIILFLTVFATFIVMKANGVALERISLGALIIALGMLVDNAIVVVEGIQVRMEQGQDGRAAAVEVVKSSWWPLLGATFVAILAFGALGFSKDSTGEFCRSLFQVVTYSLLLSWLLAVTLTPLLCVMMLKAGPVGGGADAYGGALFRGYRALLGGAVRARWVTLGVLVLLLAVAVKAFGFVEMSFFPDSTTPQFTVDYWARQGTDIRETADDLAEIEEMILGSRRMGRAEDRHPGIDGVVDVTTTIGGGSPRFMLTYAPEEPNNAYGQLNIQVDDYRRIKVVIREIESWIEEHLPQGMSYGRPFVMGPGGGSKIEVRLRGRDPKVLRRLSEEVKAIMSADPGARDVRDDWREPVEVVRPVLIDASVARLGLTQANVSWAIQRTFGGQRIGVYREGDELIPIVARAPAAERLDIDNLVDLQLWSPVAQRAVPIRQVVRAFEPAWEDAIVARRDRLPTITPQCNQRSGNASVVFARIRPKIEAMELPPGYSMTWGGEYENSGKAQKGLAASFPVILAAMVLIVVMLFNSLKQPAIIWLTVPLALIGVAAGLLGTGQPFGFMALLGALSLIGMLIKNSIVLVDEIDLQIRSGKDRYAALMDAGVSRLRPVSMAALTTVLGMVPLLPDAFFVSMAVTVMAGLTFATVLTLVVVPVLYATFFRIRPDEASRGA